MNVLGLIAQVFKPAVELIDELHTSEEEKLRLKAQTLDTYTKSIDLALSYEEKQLETRAQIVLQEAKAGSWLTQSWRPITMLTFLVLVVADQTGLLAFRLAPEAWSLLQLGLGGYVVGRSAEKVAVPVIEALKKREQT